MSETTVDRTLTDLTTLPLEEKAAGVELKLSPDREQELGNYLMGVYRELVALRTPLDNEWQDNQFRYESEFPKAAGPWPGSSDIRPPLSRVVVDTLQALYMDSLFGKTSKISATPTRSDAAGKAKKNQDYQNYQAKEEYDLYQLADKFTQDFLGPTGNAFLEPRYVVETEEREEEVTTEEPENPDDPESPKQKTTKTETYEEAMFDGVKVDLISSEFIFAAPIWDNAQEAAERDVLIKVMPQSIEEIRRKLEGFEPKYHNKDTFENIAGKKEPTQLQLAKWRVDKMSTNYLKNRIVVNTAEAYLWWKLDDPKDLNKTKMERMIVTFDADSGTVFRVIKGRCRIVHLKPFPVRGRFWGRSALTIVKPLQKHLDAIVNQRVDAGTIANLPFGFYRAGGTWNPQTFSISPAHFYPTENPGDVTFAPTPKVDQSFYLEEGKIWEYVERLFGLNENIQGLTSRTAATATESMEVSKRSSIKFGSPFKRVVNQLKPLFYHIHDLNQQFTPPEKTFRILGRDGTPVFLKFTRDEANARLNFEFDVQTIYDEQLMRDTWLLAFRLWRQDPQIALSPAYLYRLTQKSMQSVIGDTSAFLPVPEEAKLPSAEEAIELLLQGERLEPQPGIDPVHYLRVFAGFIDEPDFRELTNKQQAAVFGFFGKLKLMKEVFDKFGLNNSGIFPGLPQEQAGMPGVSVGKQPSSKFNNMKVGQTSQTQMTHSMVGNGQTPNGGGPQPMGNG